MAANKNAREAIILRELERFGSVSVKKLSADVQCSEVTIRSDIRRLEQKGYLKRIHGGAVLKQDGLNISFPIGEYLTHREEKMRIAAFAYKYIHNRDSIILTILQRLIIWPELLSAIRIKESLL